MLPPNHYRWFVAVVLPCLLAAAPALAADQAPEAPPEMIGYKLGSFYIKEYKPLQDVTTKMIFTVHASVSDEHREQFAKLQERLEGRIRDQVLIAARLATPEELQDPHLRLLRRRIMLRLKHALPRLPLDAIYISEFQLYQDS